MKKKNDIQLGDISAAADELNLKDAKIRVTMMIDLGVVREYKKLAHKLGSKYQTLMNQKLKDALLVENKKLDVIARIEKLEDYVYKKKVI